MTSPVPPSARGGNDRLQPPGTRARRRVLWGGAVLIVVAVPWCGAALLSRGMLPWARGWLDYMVGGGLVAIYAGIWIGSALLSRTPRLMALRAAATTLVIGAILLSMELTAMLRWVHWPELADTLLGRVDYQSAFVRDAELGFRRIPNLQWSVRPESDDGRFRSLNEPISFSYDRWGYRNDSEMARADVVLIGDSFVEGWYVSDDQTAAAQLQDRTGRSVANLGVAGYGTMQALRVLKGDALRRRPKVVAWFFFEGNDLYDDHGFESMLEQGWGVESAERFSH